MLKVVSANRLADGAVVYSGPGGVWFERLEDARILAIDGEAEAALEAAMEDARRNLIVDPCLVDVAEEASVLRPLTLRESIRARGPTIDYLPRSSVKPSRADGARENFGKPASRDAPRAAYAPPKEFAPQERGLAPAAYAGEIAQ
ncbi:MAG: DUF2849 domain-containing protein [Methylocapsa sp.]|nr:DUF2849 domain-containing protein [Methylocapsa sp.]